MSDPDDKKPTISQWFREREVFVTGGTGFMGKVLVAKLLLSCPDIRAIHILIREKKGVTPKTRLTSLLQQAPFRQLREKYPERLKKLVVVSGDTTRDGLGIKEEDAEILKKNVTVIVNMAANVRFDLPLKTAVNINTKSAFNVIAFAKQCKQVESFVHVSTAYCHCEEPVLEERYYPSGESAEEIMQIVNEIPDAKLEILTPKILGSQPNTYAFTKGLSEDLVYKSGLPAGIARPSIVIGSYKEPDYGWVDNTNGPTGLMIGAGKGVIRSMLCDGSHRLDVIPCDMAVNATIALVCNVGLQKPQTPIFVNLTESGENPITWEYAIETGKKHIIANPFSGPLWYPGGGITSSRILHGLAVLFLHILPAYTLDIFIMLTGNKPFLVRVQAKVAYGLSLVQYYTTKTWYFRNDGLKALRESLSPEDKRTFFMDIREIVWDDYMLSYILATRKYCLKEDPLTLPKARRVFAYLYVLDIAVKVIFAMLFVWFIYSWCVPQKATIGATPEPSFLI
ncbi:hypothetical protein QAD02_023482 [Eretmocerus hayati]|uniref:Uncharacterized protein n=1 Tax=Eretmocerus hayati TaxID=131215 RepID=A0ACC2PXL5_9HYME|nr:hypothetical protein QAD02_023482 [Eretmocerus hayati]